MNLRALLPETSWGKVRVIGLLAVLAIMLSGFAIFRVMMQAGDEVPDEAVARAVSIESQMNAQATDPFPADAPADVPAEPRSGGRARQAPGR